MTSDDRDARQRPPGRAPGATSNLTSTSPASAARSSRIRTSQRAQALDAGADDRQRVGRRMGRRPAGRSRRSTSTAWRIALVALLGRVALGDQALGLAGLLEHAPALGEDRLGLGPPVAGAGEQVAVAAPAARGQPRPARRRSAALATACLGDLEPAGVLVALRGQVVERLVELLARPARAPVGAADRGLEPVAQRRLVAREVVELVVADRRRRAEERLGRDPGQLGEDLVGERRVGDRLAVEVEADRALRAAERLLERAGLGGRPPRPARTRSSTTERASVGASHGRSDVEVAGGARDPAGEGQLDRPLDRGLAGLVRAADDGQPGREVDVEVAWRRTSVSCEPADPHSVTSWPGEQEPAEPERRRGARRPRRAWPARLELGDARLEVADERAGDRVGRREDALGQRRHRASRTRTLRNDGASSRLDLVDVEVELVRRTPMSRTSRTRSGSARLASVVDERGWLVDGRGVELELARTGPADTRSSTVTIRLPSRLVELDEEHLAGAVLVERDRLGRARVGVGDARRPGPAASSASGRARGSRGGWPRSRRR